MRTRVAMVAWAGLAMVAGTGCDLVLGFDNPTPPPGGSGGSGAGTSSGGGTTGGGTGSLCEPGTKKACAYTGDPATENVGECHAATQKCDADGTSYEPCEGEVLPAAEVCHNTEDENCDGVACAAPLVSKLWGDAGDQDVVGVSADALGNIRLWGTFVGSLDFAVPVITAPDQTGFVANIDSTLMGTWSTTNPFLTLGACGPGGACLMMSGNSGKANNRSSDGMATWSTAYAANMGAFAWAAAATADTFVVVGDLSVATTFGDTLLTPNGAPDAVLLRVSAADGSVLSAQRYGSNTAQSGRHVVADNDGNAVISGRYSGSLLVASGEAATDDLFVFRAEAGGGLGGWREGFPGDWFLHDLAADAKGSSILAGRFTGLAQVGDGSINGTGPADLFVIKLSAAGDIAWAKSFGGPTFQPAISAATSGASVIADANGNILISTRGKGTVSFGGEELGKVGEVSEFLVKLDEDGDHLWSKRFGPVGETGGCVLTVGTADEPTLACSIEAASIDFGSGPLDGKGGRDVTVAKFAP